MVKRKKTHYFLNCSKKGWSTERKKIWADIYFLTIESNKSLNNIKKLRPNIKKSINAAYRKRAPKIIKQPFEDFHYCYSNFILRATAHRDKILQMINIFLKIGLPADRVSKKLIINMEQVKKHKILKRKLETFLNNSMLGIIEEKANIFKHRLRPGQGNNLSEILFTMSCLKKGWTKERANTYFIESFSLLSKYRTKILLCNDEILKLVNKKT